MAADWHELMILQCTMRPFIACISEQLDPQFAESRHTTTPISYTRPGIHSIAHKLLLISHFSEGRRLTVSVWLQDNICAYTDWTEESWIGGADS